MKKQTDEKIKFPAKVLRPIYDYLANEEMRLNRKKKDLKNEDPFSDTDRGNDNASIDTEVAEQVGHERIAAIKMEVDKALINVRKALTRINVGSYGLCVSCGKLIDTDRLAINPTAEYCLACEKKKEKNKLKK